MNNPSNNRTYLVLGIVVTLIGGGAIIGAFVLIYLFTSVFSATPLPSPTAQQVALATEEPTQIIIRTRPPTQESAISATPTPLPLSGNTNNGDTSPSANTTFIESPEQSVVNYYRDITARNFESSWSQLTDDFKQAFNCCAPDYDLDGYLNWWNTVERVDFGDVRVIEQTSDQALVYAELIYTMENGDSFEDSDPYIELSYSTEQGRWQFIDKRDEP